MEFSAYFWQRLSMRLRASSFRMEWPFIVPRKEFRSQKSEFRMRKLNSEIRNRNSEYQQQFPLKPISLTIRLLEWNRSYIFSKIFTTEHTEGTETDILCALCVSLW